MDIQFSCNKCGQNIVIDEAGAGKSVQCPKCGHQLVVPTSVPKPSKGLNLTYYRDKAGKEIGPLPLTALGKLRFAGVINGDTPVRTADSNAWKPCREVIADTTLAVSSATGGVSLSTPVPATAPDLKTSRRSQVMVVVVAILVGLFYGGRALYQYASEKASFSFELSLDGKPLPSNASPRVRLDGEPILTNKVALGRHKLTVRMPDTEPFDCIFWVIYGNKDLGVLPLETSKGAVSLSSEPADAEYNLSGNGRNWQGKLPVTFADIPVGNYLLAANRKGWERTSEISISRGCVTTNNVEFPYGSIEITTDPTGLMIATNGTEIGKAPVVLRELKPGQYTLTASDGENDLIANIDVGPKETAKQQFVFRYGSVRLDSTPSGATVIRKGKEVGKTPLTLKQVVVGETQVGLTLDGYALTNLIIHAAEGATASLTTRLISLQYLAHLADARHAAAADPHDYRRAFESINLALQVYPEDTEAAKLRNDYDFRVKTADASDLFNKNDFCAALEKINAALVLKPDDREAVNFKQKIIPQCKQAMLKEISTTCTALAADSTNTNLLDKLKLTADRIQSQTTRPQLLTVYYLGRLCTSTGAVAETAWNALRATNPSAFANLFVTCPVCGGSGTIERPCPSCRGNPVCTMCGGSGHVNFTFGQGGAVCPHCNGTGRCRYCSGKGKISVPCTQCTNGKQFSWQKLQETYRQLLSEACNQ